LKARVAFLQGESRADAEIQLAPTPSPPVSLFDRAAWRDAAFLWTAQHIFLLAITYIGLSLFLIPSVAQRHLPWSNLLARWMAWDGDIYMRIAREGYDQFWLTRFFPLFPTLEHVLAPLTAGNPGVAGLIVSNIAELGAFGLLRVLVEREAGRVIAWRTLLYFAIFPTSFFLAAAYAEALFVVLSIGSFLALRRGRWLIAGALAALATLTRPVGILLVVPMAVEAVLRMRADRSLPPIKQSLTLVGGLVLPVTALAGFSVYLARRFGTLTAIAQSQGANGIGKSFTWPWIGVARAGHALLTYGFDPNYYQVHILLDAAFTAALVLLTIAAIGRLPLPYVWYCGAIVALLLCTPGHNWYALYSNMRFTLEVFPVFILLGRWGERQVVDRLLFAASLPLLTLFTVLFLMLQWVA
jgi:Gpi18-like mannosyltransferase